MWFFEKLMGFQEQSPERVRENLSLSGETLTSLVNGKSYQSGCLSTPSLEELRQRSDGLVISGHVLPIREVVADIQDLHCNPHHKNALFQVASQFNLLEMISPSRTPEDGVGIYELDRTQGPACAIACGGGTIYRNYFADVGGQMGQSSDRQIDCLVDLGKMFGNAEDRLWTMKNGYALATESGLAEISQQLLQMSERERDQARGRLRIGVHERTQVTLNENKHMVTQVYGSALPVAYSKHRSSHWAPFAKLILEASYEATIHAARINATQSGCNQVFLTLLGGGAFGNETQWIHAAIKRVWNLNLCAGLDINVVSYGRSNRKLAQFLNDL